MLSRTLFRSVLSLALCALPPAVCGAGGQARAECGGEVALLAGPAGKTHPTVVRRACRAGGGGQAAGQAMEPLRNGDFAAGLEGWTVVESGGGTGPGGAGPGGVSIDRGGVLLAEGDSFLVTLAQTFMLPPGAGELSFSIVLEPGFDRSAASIPDAFEVSLLDSANAPVTATWDPLATSIFNMEEGGAIHAASAAAWDGARVRIDLRAIPAQSEVTLYFDLIGADEDSAGGVRIDDVRLEAGPAQGQFVRGNANADPRLDISDGVFMLSYLFLGGEEPGCLDAADADDDGRFDITDPIYALSYLFTGGKAPPPPYSQCGADPTPQDSFDCGSGACP